MTGQSQIMKKSCFKSSTQNAKKDIFGHVAICCVFTQHFSQASIFDASRRFVTIYGFTFFLISNRIFLAEKCPFTYLRSFQPPTFGISSFSNEIFLAEKCPFTYLRSFQPWTFGFFTMNEIFHFQTKYFWLKSVRSHIFGPSNHGLFE